jgi:hypothetical protein
MARFKDFGAGSDTPAEPLSFKIYNEDFECRREMQGKVLLDLVALSGSGDNPGESAKVIGDFFRIVLVPESYERFDALTQNPDKVVTVETLGEIVGWLVEQYSDRPTSGPGVLPSGQ